MNKKGSATVLVLTTMSLLVFLAGETRFWTSEKMSVLRALKRTDQAVRTCGDLILNSLPPSRLSMEAEKSFSIKKDFLSPLTLKVECLEMENNKRIVSFWTNTGAGAWRATKWVEP